MLLLSDRPILLLLVLSTLPVHRVAAAADETPEQSRTAILQRFVEESVEITPGKGPYPAAFLFGSATQEPHTVAQREVLLSKPFRISRFEVTQELYELVTGTNPSRWKGRRNSAESMSYQDAVRFCLRLSILLRREKLIAEDQIVRLPTEVEWEYCCRAGTSTRYGFGDEPNQADEPDPKASILDEYAWHTGNAAGNDPAVGVLKPNAWGLYDMHGYLWEFVSDPYTADARPDPQQTNAASQAARIIRGGSWRDHYSLLTSTTRLAIPDHAASDAIGFRCVITGSPSLPENR
ncbi:MAG: formylglycine-generating enzyme family protein [Planctomycetaceae bacterium]|nr:formylglycine-generating enzyme family protein [Planctomycetaceae bacterium]